jgi:hypothetical protein
VSYQLVRGTSESNISETIYSGAAERFVDFDVIAGTTYFYKVVAVNDRGEYSPDSGAVEGRARLSGVIGKWNLMTQQRPRSLSLSMTGLPEQLVILKITIPTQSR